MTILNPALFSFFVLTSWDTRHWGIETLVGCVGASISQSESLHLRVTVLHKSLMVKLGEKIIRALVSSPASCQVAYETMRAYVEKRHICFSMGDLCLVGLSGCEDVI